MVRNETLTFCINNILSLSFSGASAYTKICQKQLIVNGLLIKSKHSRRFNLPYQHGRADARAGLVYR